MKRELNALRSENARDAEQLAKWEAKAVAAEAKGRKLSAERYRSRADEIREKIELRTSPAKQRARFFELAAKAKEFDALAKEARQTRPAWADNLQRCADRFRWDAAEVDHRVEWREFNRVRRRVSVGLVQEELDALTVIGISPVNFACFISSLVEEAVYALQDAGVRRGNNAGFAGFFEISASPKIPKDTRRSIRREPSRSGSGSGICHKGGDVFRGRRGRRKLTTEVRAARRNNAAGFLSGVTRTTIRSVAFGLVKPFQCGRPAAKPPFRDQFRVGLRAQN